MVHVNHTGIIFPGLVTGRLHTGVSLSRGGGEAGLNAGKTIWPIKQTSLISER